MLIKKPNASWRSRVCREVHKQFLISERHPLISDYLRSYLALLEERRRYFLEGRSVIHPLNPFNMLYLEDCDVILMGIQIICLIDIIICFNIGILKSESALIVLDRRRIARAYIFSYLLPDLISSIPVSYVLLMIRKRGRKDMLIPDFLPLVRGVRIFTILNDLRTLIQVRYKDPFSGHVPKGFTGFLDTLNVSRAFYDVSSKERYIKAMFVAASAFCSTGFNMFKTYYETEIVVNSFIMLLGAMFKMYSIVYWLKTYMTVYNSTLRYQELADQVEKFMSHHQFPGPLMRRLRDYYEYRFQDHYYKDSVALGYLSGASVVTDRTQLRDEIRLNTYQILVDKVAVLQNLPPAFLGRVMGYLEHEIFLPDDLVYHVGDLCKHVYFICTGTLALYTVKGVEAMHFEDGDFVGGVSLLTLSTRRVTTLVAIEITHTYRLSFEHMR
ncbi:potassium/sodium hyperpolarization-activated cyclic nucleotide-gated channel 3-like [Cydia splendana]|uniref:potassium/sodium hyperpolarization-activated cyclic nucleotide-gated channel 3-like n=1 Tax=Cydia splendana TaxID=1100963 RepID=UPI00300D940C